MTVTTNKRISGNLDGVISLENDGLQIGGAAPNEQQRAAVRAGIGLQLYVFPSGADDTSAIQAAINLAADAGGGAVNLDGRFTVSDTLKLPSKVALLGKGPFQTAITQTTADKPVIASENYFSALAKFPTGYTRISGIRVIGASGTSAHGIVIRDYYSRISDVEVWSCGGDGIRVSAVDDVGTINGYTLVENRFESVLISGCSGYGFHSPSETVKMTDSFVTDFVCQAASGGSLGGINIKSAAGWQIRNIHTYGTFTNAGVAINRAWNTILDGAQIEPGWGTYGLDIAATQRAFSIDNISVAGGAAGGTAIRALKDGVNPGDGFNFGSVTVINDNDVDLTAISWDSTSCPVYVASLSLIGTYATRITAVAGFGASAVRYQKDSRIASKLRDSASSVSLAVNDIPLALSKKASWSGGAAINASLAIPKLVAWTQWSGILLVNGALNYDGGVGVSAAYSVIVSAKAAGSAWSVYAVPLGTPAGFSANPVITVTNTGESGSIGVAFTATSAANYGVVSIFSAHS